MCVSLFSAATMAQVSEASVSSDTSSVDPTVEVNRFLSSLHQLGQMPEIELTSDQEKQLSEKRNQAVRIVHDIAVARFRRPSGEPTDFGRFNKRLNALQKSLTTEILMPHQTQLFWQRTLIAHVVNADENGVVAELNLTKKQKDEIKSQVAATKEAIQAERERFEKELAKIAAEGKVKIAAILNDSQKEFFETPKFEFETEGKK